MSELVPQPDHLPRSHYSFEQLEVAVEMAPLIAREDVTDDYVEVGKMMVDSTYNYLIFVNESGMFIKSLAYR